MENDFTLFRILSDKVFCFQSPEKRRVICDKKHSILFTFVYLEKGYVYRM